jgi:molybdenum cofactor cytidylyltransferase
MAGDNVTGTRAPETIHIAVLAAGESKRFGSQKLLASWRGRPLVTYSLRAAQRACPGRVLLVSGHEAEAIEAVSAADTDTIVRNPDFAGGIGTSIAAAARACPRDAAALLIALGDQPLVSADHLRTVIAAWDRSAHSIVATAYAGTFGPPVLFGREYFSALASLNGEQGAKSVLFEFRERVVTVECAPAAVDIDTQGDLKALGQADSSEQMYS